MTDGRWSVGIACSAKGDEEVILCDGQEVSVRHVVEILNRNAETDSAPGEKVEIAKILHQVADVALVCSSTANTSAEALEALISHLRRIDERMEAWQRDSWDRANRERGTEAVRRAVNCQECGGTGEHYLEARPCQVCDGSGMA